MTWIKLNYDRFLLAVVAAALLACAVLLFINVRGYNEVFAVLKGQVVPNRNAEGLNVSVDKVKLDEKKLSDPDQWEARMMAANRRLSLFVSRPYIAKSTVDPATGNTTSQPVDPYEDDPKGIIHPPVPNSWLLEHNLDILAQNVLDQDPDSDGFTNLDEYNSKTDPNDPKSHPPYWTKLVLTRFVRIPFRLRYDAGSGPYQINTVDLEQPTQFLKIGDLVKGTKFKLTKFEKKSRMDNGMNRDVSEVTLTNTDTGETVVLPKQEEVDSPTTYAVLTYLWTGKPFAVKKNQEFTLKPEDNIKYKCVELSDVDVKVVKEDENKELHIKMQAR